MHVYDSEEARQDDDYTVIDVKRKLGYNICVESVEVTKAYSNRVDVKFNWPKGTNRRLAGEVSRIVIQKK